MLGVRGRTHVCHNAREVVKGQLVEILFFSYVGPRDQLRLLSLHRYPRSHLTSSNDYFYCIYIYHAKIPLLPTALFLQCGFMT